MKEFWNTLLILCFGIIAIGAIVLAQEFRADLNEANAALATAQEDIILCASTCISTCALPHTEYMMSVEK